MTKNFICKEHYGIDDLLRIMQILRGEGGCPWDREQDHHTIRNNFIEETYEVIEAIDNDDCVLLQEELGDVLLQVVFHSQMEQEKDEFDFDDVCDGICQKLIHRHPHIFGDITANSTEEVLKNWEAIKRVEKKQDTFSGTLEAVSRALPSLIRGFKVRKRAAKAGFCSSDTQHALDNLKAYVDRLEKAIAAGNADSISEKLGDVLFSVVDVSGSLKTDPEEALYRSIDRFTDHFSHAEALAAARGDKLNEYSENERNAIWEAANKKE